MADKGDEVNLDVAASLAVLAGIAASDALCGKVLGHYSRGQRHDDAANLIQSIQPGGAHLASKFRQLVAYKDDAQYAPKTMGHHPHAVSQGRRGPSLSEAAAQGNLPLYDECLRFYAELASGG